MQPKELRNKYKKETYQLSFDEKEINNYTKWLEGQMVLENKSFDYLIVSLLKIEKEINDNYENEYIEWTLSQLVDDAVINVDFKPDITKVDKEKELAYIKGIRLMTGYGLMDIRKAVRKCGEDLSKSNFMSQMRSIHKFRI